MQVKGFMIPAEKVATCEPGDTVKFAVDAMMEKNIGALVVLDAQSDASRKPTGIVTKTDLVKGYQGGVTLDHCVSEIMSPEVLTVKEEDSRDSAAKFMEFNKIHHAVVTDAGGERFVGFVSAWDLVSECAKDDRAWPWIRSEDGKFHKPFPGSSEAGPPSPRSTARPRSQSHTYLDYINSVRNLREMDD